MIFFQVALFRWLIRRVEFWRSALAFPMAMRLGTRSYVKQQRVLTMQAKRYILERRRIAEEICGRCLLAYHMEVDKPIPKFSDRTPGIRQ